MKTNERALMKKWVDTWAKTGKALERIRREEIAAISSRSRRRAADVLLDAVPRRRSLLARTSGMVIMQEYFQKMHKQSV